MKAKNIKGKLIYTPNLLLSLLVYPLWSIMHHSKKDIIIFGFGNNYYENNTRFLYEYYISNFNDKYCIYAVFDKGARDTKKIERKRLLFRGYFKTYMLFFESTAVIFDTYNSDVAPGIQKYYNKTKRIFITHGMEGLKNIDFMLNNKFIVADLMFAASEYEKSIRNQYGYYPNICVTGYPRFDHNGDVDTNERKIVVLLTWRNYLNAKNIKESLYFNKIIEIIGNQELSNFCAQNKITCYVKIHHEVVKCIKNLHLEALPNIVINQDFDFSTVLSQSALLVTDYSSLAWDFIFYDKPVIFYQFDKDEYETKCGRLYTDVQKEQLGYCATSVPDIVNQIKMLFKNEPIPKKRIPSKSKFFMYDDKNNTARVVKSITDFLNIN